MTDRANYLVVVLEKDTRTDDLEGLCEAICQMRGVLRVEPNIVTMDDWVAESRIKIELTRKIYEALK